MPNKHKYGPIPFRPSPEGLRHWLKDYARRTGKAVNAILNEALDAYRKQHEQEGKEE